MSNTARICHSRKSPMNSKWLLMNKTQWGAWMWGPACWPGALAGHLLLLSRGWRALSRTRGHTMEPLARNEVEKSSRAFMAECESVGWAVEESSEERLESQAAYRRIWNIWPSDPRSVRMNIWPGTVSWTSEHLTRGPFRETAPCRPTVHFVKAKRLETPRNVLMSS